MLTKDSWDKSDLRPSDVCWREAAHSDLFADEFEPERHRIRRHVEAARTALAADRIASAAR
jgi:hypothetical protein